MAYIQLPLGIRVALEYRVFGKIVVNVYHVTTTDPIVTIKLLDIAEIFESWWDVDMKVAMSLDIALEQVTCLNLDVPNGEKLTLIVSPAIPGTNPDPAVPNNVAIVGSFSTAKTGRSFRGRTYQAGLPETVVTGNNIPIATAAFLVTNYATLVGLLFAANVDLVVASFQSLGVPRAVGVATVVETVEVNTRVDTQRRRLTAS